MIRIEGRTIILETAHTHYIMHADEYDRLVHLYYGERIVPCEGMLDALGFHWNNPDGCSIAADPGSDFHADSAALELSFRGKGDMREPFAEIIRADGTRTCDFRFESAEILPEKPMPEGMPGAYFEKESSGTSVCIRLKDRNSELQLELYYCVFEDHDCITRFARLINSCAETVRIDRMMSLQLDLEMHSARISAFRGEWAREMGRCDTILRGGKWINDSSTGFSSNQANPFIMVGEPSVNETSGECYAFNLIWSGCHREIAEINEYGMLRVSTGMNPDLMEWTLAPGESFDSPEAVMTYSPCGYETISAHMHGFVREHIVRGTWKKRVRPILINSWEAMYFDLNKSKLLKLAEAAKKTGIELFVMDDGWFGTRDNDRCALGDWKANEKKLPGGLEALSSKIKAMGMLFGIWVEPEMVNADSDLYRAHPDWAVRIPGKPHAEGRNQMLLDLTREDVRTYIIESMSDVFTRGSVDYVKWDMNRNFSDMYSCGLSAQQSGEFSVRYIRGLYAVLDELVKRFPNILFEACASGGNRFDLGMLCYMPQIWASDCTDPVMRATIQNGYSYGYPQSVLGAHVSASPNHQTLRRTPIETRYSIAAGGALGYECNLCDASAEDLRAITAQVSEYKQWRDTLQFGSFRRIGGRLLKPDASPRDCIGEDLVQWQITSEDGAKAAVITMQYLSEPNRPRRKLRTRGLTDEKIYHFYNRPVERDLRVMGDLINTQTPIHIRPDSLLHDIVAKVKHLDGDKEDIRVSGALLNHAGVQLAQRFAGTGLGANTAICLDHHATIYFMEAE